MSKQNVTVAIRHAGFINKNGFVYTADALRKAAENSPNCRFDEESETLVADLQFAPTFVGEELVSVDIVKESAVQL